MFAPKRPGSVENWLKDARKLIKEIPQDLAVAWETTEVYVSPKWINMTFKKKTSDERISILIDRGASALG